MILLQFTAIHCLDFKCVFVFIFKGNKHADVHNQTSQVRCISRRNSNLICTICWLINVATKYFLIIVHENRSICYIYSIRFFEILYWRYRQPSRLLLLPLLTLVTFLAILLMTTRIVLGQKWYSHGKMKIVISIYLFYKIYRRCH